MNYSLNVKSSSIVHTLLSNCVKLLGKVQKLLIKCISYSVISKRIRVVSPNFTQLGKILQDHRSHRSQQISCLPDHNMCSACRITAGAKDADKQKLKQVINSSSDKIKVIIIITRPKTAWLRVDGRALLQRH